MRRWFPHDNQIFCLEQASNVSEQGICRKKGAVSSFFCINDNSHGFVFFLVCIKNVRNLQKLQIRTIHYIYIYMLSIDVSKFVGIY